MAVAVNNRFGILLAEKRVREKRAIPLSEIAEATGVSRPTLYAWQNNTVSRAEFKVINALCKYFSVTPGELFEYIPDLE